MKKERARVYQAAKRHGSETDILRNILGSMSVDDDTEIIHDNMMQDIIKLTETTKSLLVGLADRMT